MDATQKKGSPKQLRGRSLGTKLSETEYAQCEKSAARRGQALSESCRFSAAPSQAGRFGALLFAWSGCLCCWSLRPKRCRRVDRHISLGCRGGRLPCFAEELLARKDSAEHGPKRHALALRDFADR